MFSHQGDYAQPRDWRGQLPDAYPPAEPRPFDVGDLASRWPADETRAWPSDGPRNWMPRPEHVLISERQPSWYEDRFSRFTWGLIRLAGVLAALAVIAVAVRIIWAVWP